MDLREKLREALDGIDWSFDGTVTDGPERDMYIDDILDAVIAALPDTINDGDYAYRDRVIEILESAKSTSND